MLIIYSNQDLELISRYRADKKAEYANKRFKCDTITVSDVLNSLKRVSFKCHYCKDPLDPKTWQLDHFYAKGNGGKNTEDNICPSCKWCNQMKNSLTGYNFLIRCKKIILANLETGIPHPVIKGESVKLSDFPINQRHILGKTLSKKTGYIKFVFTD